DLKPGNVLLAPPADEPGLNTAWGCPKVTDFGLAREIESEQLLTQPGAVMGTPQYMAPEQAEGDRAGPAADVYALGAILYRLLAGRQPFEAPSTGELLYKVRHEAVPPPPPSATEVPPELERLCLSCLEKEPGKRPAAAQLAEQLERFLPAGPGEAPPRPARPETASRHVQRAQRNWMYREPVSLPHRGQPWTRR